MDVLRRIAGFYAKTLVSVCLSIGCSFYYGGFLPFCLTSLFWILYLTYQLQDMIVFNPQNVQNVILPTTYHWESLNFFSKGYNLHGYFLSSDGILNPNRKTILYFHGNSDNIGLWLPRTQGLLFFANVFIFDYRGYGRSEGFPSEKGIYEDGIAAFNFVRAHPLVNPERIVFFGTSLGGAVALEMATRNLQINGLILENTFLSIQNMARVHFGIRLPSFCFKNKFDNLSKIQNVTVPTMFLSGLDDLITPTYMIERLHHDCNSIKRIRRFNEVGHTNIWISPTYFYEIRQFLNSLE